MRLSKRLGKAPHSALKWCLEMPRVGAPRRLAMHNAVKPGGRPA